MGEFLASESLRVTKNWTHLLDDIKDYPGEVEPAVTEAESFKPGTDIGLCTAVCEILDTLCKDWLG